MSGARCGSCNLPSRLCLCSEVVSVQTRTRLVLVQHWLERNKPTNTARLAALSLPALTWMTYGGPDRSFDASRLPTEDTWLLYPEGAPQPSRATPPRTLIILDGSWSQARRMAQHVAPLRTLPRLVLPAPPPGSRRLRQPLARDGMSTLEAVARALAMLEGEEVAAPLWRLHDLQVTRTLSCR